MDDKSIVQLYWDRDERAISRTAEKYDSYCHTISKNILGNDEDARECVNDTYLKAWNTIPPYRPGILSVFLGKAVRNISFNMYKKRRAGKRGGGTAELILDELDECIPDRIDSYDEKLKKEELADTINSFLDSLNSKNRNIFLRRYWYADSISDIAQSLNMTENNVSVILNRLRKKMRKHLEERGINL